MASVLDGTVRRNVKCANLSFREIGYGAFLQIEVRGKFVFGLIELIEQVGPVSQYSHMASVLDSAVRQIVKCANLSNMRNGPMGFLCELGAAASLPSVQVKP